MSISPDKAFLSLRAYGLFAIFLLIGAVGGNAAALSRTFERAIYPISAALCVLVALRVVFGADLFIYTKEISAVGVNDGGRPLSTFGTMILGITAVFTLSKMIADENPPKWAATIFAGLVVAILITGQGTATIASGTGLALVMLLQRGRFHGARIAVTLAALLIVALTLMVTSSITDSSFYGTILPEDLAKNLTRRQGNYQTRLQAWQGILTAYADADPVKKLIGWPAGTSPYVEIINQKWGRIVWNVSAHNMYIGTLISHGAVGAFLFISLLVSRLTSLIIEYLSKSPKFLHTPRLIAALVMVAIFSYSYDLRNEGGLILAVTLIGAQAFYRPPREGLVRDKSPHAETRRSMSAHGQQA
jgi:hypothetical protein